MQPRWCLALGVVVATLGVSRGAHADPAAAEALFREGHRLLTEGRYDEAAAKLSESQAQDPASGTLINLALAYERQGKLATAWATYQQAAILARRDGRADRVASAERKRAELEPRVPQLKLHADHPVPGLSIQWGSVRMGAGALDSAIPTDPGDYRLVVEAPGRQTWEVSINMREGEQRMVTIPELAALAGAPTSEPAASVEPVKPAAPIVSPTPTAVVAPREATPVTASNQRTLAWVLGASGLASVGVGAIFGVHALNRYSDARHGCPSHTNCDSSAIDDWHSARTSAWISNVGIGVGAVACAAGAWLFFRSSGDAPHAVGFDITPLRSGAALTLRSSL